MTSNPKPPKRTATKKKITNEEPQPQIIKVEQPESKLKRLSDEQYKQRLEEQFKERQEEKKRQEERQEKQRQEEQRQELERQEKQRQEQLNKQLAEEREEVLNDNIEYVPILPERSNGQMMPEIAFKFIMEVMPQFLEELQRAQKYKGSKKNIHLKIPNDFTF